tara:strand:+ start:53 stop:589 length:537 start_codon:yes stop_codon:yes gene_type:complete
MLDLRRLEMAGLHVVHGKWHFRANNNLSALISKPDSAGGNFRPSKLHSDGRKSPKSCPSSNVYAVEEKFAFEVHCVVPGPGPGDFVVEFPSLDDAMDSAIDYYFGDPIRMNPPVYVHADRWKQIYRSICNTHVKPGRCSWKNCNEMASERRLCAEHAAMFRQRYKDFLAEIGALENNG